MTARQYATTVRPGISRPDMGSPSFARGSATSDGKDQPTVNHTYPVSLKHYPRIQRQPELPRATIPDGRAETAVHSELVCFCQVRPSTVPGPLQALLMNGYQSLLVASLIAWSRIVRPSESS